jgi:hypothetical protein
LGDGYENEFYATIKLWQRLIINPTYNYSELSYPNDGGKIFAGYVLRTRINYQLAREWFLRLIVQYENFDRTVSIEPLLSYKLNPFTIFYLGSTHGYQKLGNTSPDYEPTSRQFFLKFQYLFRA